jgi:alpha-N-acetylglucosaminidase
MSTRSKLNAVLGTGLTPEAIEQNPIVYELMTEITWYEQPFSASDWVPRYAARRYGSPPTDPSGKLVQQAWSELLPAVYNTSPADESAHGIFERVPTVTSKMGMSTDSNATLLVDAAM